ncbi:MAG: hypothetical protein A2293_16740 [Elusimicrobia bacterium RIFOXYB2_FULL_49_7]|nr:MAG: hypothetical protein A2293_16740 [Elusimicrobia bacterium RIFOXYB2_FULL_49_7]
MTKLMVLIFLLTSTLFSSENTGIHVQPRKLINCLTAGSLPKGHYDVNFNFSQGGSLNSAIDVGLTNRLSLGIAYQVMGLIGQDDIRGQSFPGGFLKYRLIEESYSFPAFALGFESQGSGYFFKKSMSEYYFPRFYYKSKGLFASLSKSYLLIGMPLGFHLEGNYSFIDNQADSELKNRHPDVSCGMDIGINDEISLLIEYDAALDDNNTRNPLKGYLNTGLRWFIVSSLVIEIDLIDLLENKDMIDEFGNKHAQEMSREVRISYIDRF